MSRIGLNGKRAGETSLETFDFTSKLSASETVSTASVAATVYSGTDASPSALISGTSTISGQKVTQLITGGLLGVVYLLVCTITTSLSQTRKLSAYLVIVEDSQ